MVLRFWLCGLALGCFLAPALATQDLIATFKIREKCAAFDRQSSGATRQTRMVSDMAHEGSTLTAFSLKGRGRKLSVTHLGTMGKQQETIYLEQGRPVWVTRIETKYDAPLSGRVVERIKESLYFQNGALIQRDFMPVSIIKGANRRDKPWIHQTSVTSKAQASEWKATAQEWQEKVAQYERALGAKQ